MSGSKTALALVAVSAFGQTSLEPKDLRWRTEAEVAAPVEFATLELRKAMYERSESEFRDLRIVGPDGKEVGWAWARNWGGRGERPAQTRRGYSLNYLVNRVLTPQGAFQFVAPIGLGQGPHHAITFSVDEKEFQREVLIETGDDLKNWDVAARGSIIRILVEGKQLQSLRVSYPASTRRYVRVTVEDWPDPKTLSAVEVDSREEAPEEWEVLGRVERPQRSELPGAPGAPYRVGASRWEISLDLPPLSGGRLAMETPSTLFARGAGVESSEDGERWSGSGSGTVYRTAGAEELAVPLGRVFPRHMRLSVTDWDNPPVEISAARLEAPVRRVVFTARAAGRYLVYLGREGALMPEYDVRAVLARSAPVEPVLVRVGEWTENPDYVAPVAPEKPVSERFPWLLPGVLGLAVLGMGYTAWQLLRKAG